VKFLLPIPHTYVQHCSFIIMRSTCTEYQLQITNLKLCVQGPPKYGSADKQRIMSELHDRMLSIQVKVRLLFPVP
jgi:hypothetical protein